MEPSVEREKLLSWRIFLMGCEAEFERALKDLSRLPPEHRGGAEEFIQELESSLEIVRDGFTGEPLTSLLQEKVRRENGRFPSLDDMGLEPRIERGGLRATQARLVELETWH